MTDIDKYHYTHSSTPNMKQIFVNICVGQKLFPAKLPLESQYHWTNYQTSVYA